MNIAFYFIVIALAVWIWVILSPKFKSIGSTFIDTAKNVKKDLSEEDSDEKEKENDNI